ncbi:MAG TPA: hypothetical protein PKA64_06215, partial [Myxococcota bacterium]|nr:hypothetical protein [Myxococcota bacterium]
MTRLITALALVAGCQEYTVRKPPIEPPEPPPECAFEAPEPDPVPVNPLCDPVEEPPGGFRPIVEWSAGRNESCTALPAVGDLDGDGLPEVVANFVGGLLGGTPGKPGDLVVINGQTGREKWRRNAEIGYGSAIALGNITGDPLPEIVVVTTVEKGFVGFAGRYAVRAYSNTGDKLWETESYGNDDFDYATAPIIADMDHDGSPEIIAGRVIFNADGTLRGRGRGGRGSWGVLPGPGGGLS